MNPQLLHDAVLTGINIFILFFALSYLLFNPVRDVLEKRNRRIAGELASAAEAAPVDAAALVEAAVEVEEELPPQAVMAAAVPRTAAPFRKLRREIFFMVLSLL